ncbi:MAG: sodium/solute symporter [Thermoguttaceae bacterium]|nr:sodium/solute symporter [Thermoguttaceae bacterium]
MTLDLPFVLTAVFFLALLVIASWGMRRTQNTSDFFLGGRTLGPWVLAISYGTSYFSAVVFIGFAGQYGWLCGFGGLWVGLFNALAGGALAWLVLGRMTRKMTQRMGAMTMPEFFAKRYNSNGMKIITAIVIFVFLLPYSASVFSGLGYLFKHIFGLQLSTAITIITVVTGLYVVFGGYKAAARIDFIQGVIMFFGALLMVWFVLAKFGAPQEAVQKAFDAWQARVAQGAAGADAPLDAVKPIPAYILWSVVFMTSFATWGLPQMVHKYYAIKDESQIVRGAVITTIFALVIGCGAYFCGGLTHLLPTEQLSAAISDVSGKDVIDTNRLVPIMLIYALPGPLLALILLLVLSASMSTLSSLALVSSSAVSIDLYKGYAVTGKSEKHYLRVMRFLCAVFVILSWLIAIFNPAWIVPLMSLAWGSVAGAFLAPYLYGLFWRGTTKAGAYAGMFTGLILSNGIFFYRYFAMSPQAARLFSPVSASIAMVVPLVVVPLVSVMTKKVDPETVDKAFGDQPK